MERKDVDGLGGTINFLLNQQLGLYDSVGGQLRLRNTKGLVQLAHHYDSAPKKVPLL